MPAGVTSPGVGHPQPSPQAPEHEPPGGNGAGGEHDAAPAGPSAPAGRRTPRLVWWITALHVVLLGAYSLLLPTYRSPDEPLHVDLAHLFANELRYPAWDDRDTGPGVQRSLSRVQFNTKSAHLSADEAMPKGDRPSFEDLEEPFVRTGINQLPQHPPLYYVVAGGAERALETVTGDLDFQLETWFYRLVSIALVAPLPFIIWRIARLLALPPPVGIAATLVPLAIPQYLHIGSSANNDSLQLVLFWLTTPLVLRLARGDLRTRTAGLTGLVLGLGLLTKGLTAMMCAWVAAALALALVRAGRAAVGSLARATAVVGAVAVAVGGWWWVRNLVVYGQLMPSRYGQLLGPEDEDTPRNVGVFFQTWASKTTQRFWGDFGWYDVHLPTTVIVVASIVCVAAIVVACVGRDRVAGSLRGDRLLLAAPFVLLAGGQFTFLLQGYLDTGRFSGLQGRYWFGSLAALSVLIALGMANVARRWLHVLPLAVLIAATVIQGFAASTLLGFYWGEPGSAIGDRLRAVVAWAPVPGELIGVGSVVGVVVVAVAVAATVGMAVRRPPARAPRPLPAAS